MAEEHFHQFYYVIQEVSDSSPRPFQDVVVLSMLSADYSFDLSLSTIKNKIAQYQAQQGNEKSVTVYLVAIDRTQTHKLNKFEGSVSNIGEFWVDYCIDGINIHPLYSIFINKPSILKEWEHQYDPDEIYKDVLRNCFNQGKVDRLQSYKGEIKSCISSLFEFEIDKENIANKNEKFLELINKLFSGGEINQEIPEEFKDFFNLLEKYYENPSKMIQNGMDEQLFSLAREYMKEILNEEIVTSEEAINLDEEFSDFEKIENISPVAFSSVTFFKSSINLTNIEKYTTQLDVAFEKIKDNYGSNNKIDLYDHLTNKPELTTSEQKFCLLFELPDKIQKALSEGQANLDEFKKGIKFEYPNAFDGFFSKNTEEAVETCFKTILANQRQFSH